MESGGPNDGEDLERSVGISGFRYTRYPSGLGVVYRHLVVKFSQADNLHLSEMKVF
jgi:hypothetical protein